VFLALCVAAGVGWFHFLFAGLPLEGTLSDALTSAPVEGARVVSTQSSSVSGADGTFRLEGLKLPQALSIEAPGYRPTTVRTTFGARSLHVTMEPITLDLRVTDQDTGEHLAAATATAGTRAARVVGTGTLQLSPMLPSERITVSADGYLPQEVTFNGEASLDVSLPARLVGRVTEAATGRAMAGIRLSTPFGSIVTDADGAYQLPRRTGGGVISALVPGYRRATLEVTQHGGLDLALKRNEVKALYMTYFAIGHPSFRERMFHLLDTTELNAVVIDVKGDPALLAYRSRVPLAEQIGANAHPTVNDLDDLLKALHDRGVYAIARIVVFKDDLLARNGASVGVDVSIKDGRSGGPWIDGEGLGWVDPFQTAAWDYNIALAREAIERGFDEVQFDYIRFPTDPRPGSSLEDAQYLREANEESRVQALASFLEQAREAVHAAGGFLGIDTYGYTTFWEDDGGIGQNIAVLANYVDYVCFMVYPSTYDAGLPGSYRYPEVVRRPYDVVYESLTMAESKLAGKPPVVRPWLQYFDDYPWATEMRYDAPQIEAQKQAAKDAGALGWMLWDPFNNYDRGGLAPE
jgi:hypothetical protein